VSISNQFTVLHAIVTSTPQESPDAVYFAETVGARSRSVAPYIYVAVFKGHAVGGFGGKEYEADSRLFL
jgi:hypothetical protein